MKITICGSMAFHKEMEETATKLREWGHEVKTPLLRVTVEENGKSKQISIREFVETNGGISNFDYNHEIWEEKKRAIDEHISKVEWSDVILVVNHDKKGIPGYIGGNTLIEIGVAEYLGKKIYVLNPFSLDLSYAEEILGARPVILNGKLELIK